MFLLKKYKTILTSFVSTFREWWARSQPAIKLPRTNLCAYMRPFFFCFVCFTFFPLEPSSHFIYKLFAETTNVPLISLLPSPPRAAGLSYLFAIDHRGVAHRLESSRWGEAAFAIKQWGAVWNLRKRQLPPMPVGWGSDDEEVCFRHSTPPTGTLMQAACKPTPRISLSAGG